MTKKFPPRKYKYETESDSESKYETEYDSDSGYESDNEDVDTTNESKDSDRRLRMENLVREARKKDPGVKPTAKLKEYLKGKDISDGRIPAFKFPIIKDDGDDELTLHDSRKGSGFDENFQTAKFAHGAKPTLKDIDDEIFSDTGSEEDRETFRQGFVYSRLRTNEYLHVGGKKNKETHSHTGGLFNSRSGNELESIRVKGMHGFHAGRQKYAKQAIDSVLDLKSEAKTIAKEIKKLEENLESQQEELEEIKKEKRRDRDKIKAAKDKIEKFEKKLSTKKKSLTKIEKDLPDKAASAPRKATIEALDYVVQNTIGYRDNPEYKGDDARNSKIIFKGYTTSGLDLSDSTEREYALKTLQSSRDKFKLTMLKLDDNLPDDLSDIERINEEIEERGYLTPVRSGTPYSDANLKAVMSELSDAKDYVEICQVAAKATPAIVPSGKGILGREVKVSAIASKIGRISLNNQDSDLSDIDDDSSDGSYLSDSELDFETSENEYESDSTRSSSPTNSVSSASSHHLVSKTKSGRGK